MFENKPQGGMAIRMFRFLENDYTVFVVLRVPGMPQGYGMGDMANDYAQMIAEEFGGSVDVIGFSTGGSIIQYFAADYPDLVRRMVIQSSAHTLSDPAKRLQLQIADLAGQGRYAEANYVMLKFILPTKGIMKVLARPTAWLGSQLMSLSAPDDPSDLVITVEAEDRHNFKDRLGEIKAPTLVVAGTDDPFYTPEIIRETAEGIPNARLILYEGRGHLTLGKQFQHDVLAFLRE